MTNAEYARMVRTDNINNRRKQMAEYYLNNTVTIVKLAEEVGVSERTVYRDLNALKHIDDALYVRVKRKRNKNNPFSLSYSKYHRSEAI